MKYKIFEQQALDFLTLDPNFCASNGVEKNLGDLPDPGKNQRLKTQGKLKMFNKLLKEVEAQDKQEEQDLKLWALYFEQMRLDLELEIDQIPKIMRLPHAFGEIVDPIFLFFINDPRPASARIINIISRLNKSMGYIQSYVKNLRTPVKRWVEIELDAISGFDTFANSLREWAEKENFPKLNLLDDAITTAKSAFQFYKRFLADIDKTENFFLGEDQMKQVIAARGIELDPEEIHQIAKKFLKENAEEVENLRSKLVEKYSLSRETDAAQLQEFLSEKFATPYNDFEDIIVRYQKEQNNILKWLSERKLFPIFENQTLEIMRTPKFMEPSIPAGAMLCPLSLREGMRKSVIYLTLREELLAEHTELSIPNMMIHEGIPGHHLHLATATNHSSAIRRFMPCNDLAEGWTTMLEDYMLDQGYCSELADEVRFIAKRDIARIGARVAIDLYFMSGDKKYLDVGVKVDLSSDDPFVAAGNLLEKVTGFVPARVQAELNWYSQESGYPMSYLIGNHLMKQLKRDFLAEHKSDDFSFHSYILSQGKAPLAFLKLNN